MAETFVERRKRELGLSGGASKDSMSFVDRRKAELGMGDWPAESENAQRGRAAMAHEDALSKQRVKDNMDRTDRMMSTEDSSQLRAGTYEAPKKEEPKKKSVVKQVLGGVKDFSDKSGITKNVGYLAEAANTVLNAPGDLIRETTKLAKRTGAAYVGSGASEKVGRILPQINTDIAIGAKRVLDNEIPGVSTGPVGNFIRGATDTLDFGTGKALDEAFGNTNYLEGRNTKAAKAGEITAIAAPFVGLSAALTRKAVGAMSKSGKVADNVPIPSVTRGATQAVVEPVAKPKRSLYTMLFGNQGVGISAGGKTPRRSGTGMQIVDNPLKKDAQNKIDEAKELGRTIKQDYIDLTAPLKHLGGDVQDVALDARRSNNLANSWVHDKAVTPEGNVIGVSLKDVIGSVPRGEADAFEDYLIVRHAKTRVARGEKVYEDRTGMNDVDKLLARQGELEKRFPHFQSLGARWDEYNANLLDTGESFGLISKAQKEAMRTDNPNYASMRRQFSTSEKFSQPFAMKSNSFSGQKAPIKAVSPTGSARKIVSPVRTAIEQTGAWMNAGMRNRVMQSLLQRVHADPEAMRGLVEIVPETSQVTAKSLKEINDVLKNDGMEGLTEFLNQDFSMMFRKASQMGAKTDNIVTVMVDGNPVKLNVANPEIFKSLVGMSPEESNFVLDFFGMLSNATKRGATGALAPLFAAKSLTVDVAQAIIQSKNPLQHVPDLLHATVSSIANQLPRNTPGFEKIRALAQEFERTGGEYSAALRGDKPLRKAVGSLRKEPLLSPRGIGKGAIATVKAPFRALEGVSDVAENVNRIAAYKGAMRRAGGERTPEAVRGAMRESQEITTNFSRKGAKSETIEKFIPYSNAAIQGMRRFAVQLRDNPGKTALMVGGFVIAPKLWEQARFGDDPDYQKIPARTRYRNIIWGKNADGTFNMVPMPPEYTAIGALAADSMAEIKGQDYVKWRDVSDALVNAYTPPFVSGALQGATQPNGPKSALEQSGWGLANSSSAGPIIGTLANQSWTGAPIVSQTYAANSPYMQKDERTSGPSEWLASTGIGKKLGLSPIKMDYLVKQYGGDLARLGLPLTSDVGAGTVSNTLLKSFIVDPEFTNNLSRDYYNRVDTVKAIAADVTDGAKGPAWYNDDVKKLATSSAKGTPGKMIKDLNDEKRAIQADKTISAKDKAERLRQVQTNINNIYLDVASRLDAMGVPR